MRLRPRVIRSDRPRNGVVLAAGTQQDGPVPSIIKWIPIEIIGVYKSVSGLGAPDGSFVSIIWILCLAATPLWIAFAAREPKEPVPVRQVILSSIAFLVWTAGTESWIAHLFAWKSQIGSAILFFGTLLLPILDGVLKSMGIRQAA